MSYTQETISLQLTSSLHALPTDEVAGLPNAIGRCAVGVKTHTTLHSGSPSQEHSLGFSVNAWHIEQRLVPYGMPGVTQWIAMLVCLV
jgi:hypothetical protein